MANLNLYRPSSNWYMRIVRFDDELVWDFTAGALSSGPGWGNSYVVLTFNSHIGGHPVDLPGLPKGKYDLLYYDAASPDPSDEVLFGQEWVVL